MKRKIEFYRHNLTYEDKKNCSDVLNSLFLTTGTVTQQFEEKFSKFLGAPYSIGVNSCTDALFLSLKCLGISKGDEIITTPLSFIASSNVIEYCGATPVFADVDNDTGNISPQEIEKKITKKTKAIIVVHLYGHMCDMKKIKKIAKKHNLKIIEDCAHCIEGERDGMKAGETGDFGCFSFYATKNITSGEGGCITVHKKQYKDYLVKARQHGMSKNAAQRYTKKYEHYDMEFLGYKSGMNNIQASLLLSQLDRIEKYRLKKQQIAMRYTKAFEKNSFISMPKVLQNTKHAWHLYTIWVNPQLRDRYLNILQEKGIGVAVNFRPIHLMGYYVKKYKYKTGDFPIAERIGNSTISLPLYPKLTTKEIDYIIRTVNEVVKA